MHLVKQNHLKRKKGGGGMHCYGRARYVLSFDTDEFT